ncbi:flagellar basal body-associated FliL family protein [Pseudomonas xionganensis]|uniref:Flagellar protein FliL n=1 Tax=Pseudomonas xionganensis TaxID=2654845 RepID=A0A6I4KNE6_9PSED|nr:flagellar basal body-associated FliL family protein [Pseudomonas xionganensis]MVW73815.1 flagellar basal body-associated protein FliL [Pseudomonas xionganensis]
MKALVVVLLSLFVSLPLMAEEEKAPPPAAIYINLFPALVGNFGEGPKLKFYKAEVSLRVEGAEDEAKVKHHDPLIRNQLVMLFSQQSEAALEAPDARETLRQEALKQVQQVLQEEEGKPLVVDLLFNNLILQR